MEVQREKPILSISISSHLYQRLKKEIGDRKVSGFVEKAVAKELGEYDKNLDNETKKFQQKLVAGYKRAAQSKALRKEEKVGEEAIEDILN